MQSHRLSRHAAGFTAAVLLFGSAVFAAPEARNPGPVSKDTLAIVRHASEIYVYTYPQKIGGLDPHKDPRTRKRITDRFLVDSFRKLIEANAVFQPAYRKRCMPIYDYGIEFRAQGKRRRAAGDALDPVVYRQLVERREGAVPARPFVPRIHSARI